MNSEAPQRDQKSAGPQVNYIATGAMAAGMFGALQLRRYLELEGNAAYAGFAIIGAAVGAGIGLLISRFVDRRTP